MKIILTRSSVGRTFLSLKANINYATLLRHLAWLKNKSLIELILEDDKVNIKFTEHGRKFATQFCSLMDEQIDQSD